MFNPIQNLQLVSEAKRKRFRERFRDRVGVIVYDELGRYGHARPMEWDEEMQHRFSVRCLRRLRHENPDELGIVFTLLFWMLQGTVIYFVQKWWRERDERKKREEEGL
jgi:hypothetical protein